MKVQYKGELRDSKVLAEEHGIKPKTFEYRIKKGYDIETALSKKSLRRFNGNKPSTDHLGNKYSSEKEMAEAHGIPYSAYKSRKHLGWSLEDRLTKPHTRYKPRNGEEYHEYELEKLEKEGKLL